jgi:4-hydroxythreonine-4-phosphate dehydrogenase
VKIIGLTMGDPGGIGPETVLGALPKYLKLQKKGTLFLLIGSPDVFQKAAKVIGKKFKFKSHKRFDLKSFSITHLNILETNRAGEFDIAKMSKRNGQMAFEAVRVGAELAQKQHIAGLMTAPLNKGAVRLSRKSFEGHTEYLGQVSKTKNFAMMLQGGPLKVILVTTHIPLKKVPQAVTTQKIIQKGILAHNALKKQLGRAPIIGIAGLNPHAGEGGLMGREDKTIIEPAVKSLKRKKIKAVGPMPPDTIFRAAYIGKLDAIVAMYHDQGLTPLKMIAFDEGINVTLGLSFLRSSPDHGTGFDIAYKGKASPRSTEKAIEYLL